MNLETIQSIIQNFDFGVGIGSNDLGITVYEFALDFINYSTPIF